MKGREEEKSLMMFFARVSRTSSNPLEHGLWAQHTDPPIHFSPPPSLITHTHTHTCATPPSSYGDPRMERMTSRDVPANSWGGASLRGCEAASQCIDDSDDDDGTYCLLL
jgi:hypothetical protein